METELIKKSNAGSYAGGRPRLPPEDRTVSYNFACTPNKYREISNKAVKAGLSLSSYLVKCALEAPE